MKPWTEAHRREALRRTYEIAAELAGDGRARDAEWCCAGAAVYAETDELFYMALTGSKPGPDFDNARINREVRRVRALAEGRLVREVVWRVTNARIVVWEGSYRPGHLIRRGRHTARATRIRRA